MIEQKPSNSESSISRLLKLIDTKISLSILNTHSGGQEINENDTHYFADAPAIKVKRKQLKKVIGQKAEECKLPGIRVERKEVPKENVDVNVGKSAIGYYSSSFKKTTVKKVTRKRVEPKVSVNTRRRRLYKGRLVLPDESNYNQIVTFVKDVKDIVHPGLTPVKTRLPSRRQKTLNDTSMKKYNLTIECIRKSNLKLIENNRRNVIKNLISTSVIEPHIKRPEIVQAWNEPFASELYSHKARKLNIQNKERIFLYPSLKLGLKETKLNLAVHDISFVTNIV